MWGKESKSLPFYVRSCSLCIPCCLLLSLVMLCHVVRCWSVLCPCRVGEGSSTPSTSRTYLPCKWDWLGQMRQQQTLQLSSDLNTFEMQSMTPGDLWPGLPLARPDPSATHGKGHDITRNWRDSLPYVGPPTAFLSPGCSQFDGKFSMFIPSDLQESIVGRPSMLMCGGAGIPWRFHSPRSHSYLAQIFI